MKCSINGRPVPCPDETPGGDRPGSSGPTREQLGAQAYNSGLASYRERLWTDAQQAFRRATELLPGDADAQYMLGAALSAPIVEQWNFLFNLGRAQEPYGDELEDGLKAAIAAFRKAHQLGHAKAGAELQRLQLEARLAQFRAAREAWRDEQKRKEERERPYHAAYGKGRELYDEGRWSEAEEYFRRAVRLMPDSADAYFFLALSLHNQRKLEDAVAAYQEVLRRNPGPREAEGTREWLPMAQALVAKRANDSRAAEIYARRALAANPDNPDAHGTLGWALYKQQRVAEAESALRESLRLAPDVVSRRQDLARVLEAQSKRDEAERELREALRRDPKNTVTTALLEAVALNHAMSLRLGNQDVQAEQVLRRALADLPNSTKTRAALADVLLKRADGVAERQPANAEALYRETIKLTPNNARAHNNLGVLLQGQGKTREAEAAYREAIRLEPANAQGYRNLTALLQQQGRAPEAVAIYRDWLRTQPGDQAASQGLQAAIAADAQGRINRLVAGLTPFPAGGPHPVPSGASRPPDSGPGPRTAGGQVASAEAHGQAAKTGAAAAGTETERQSIGVLDAGRERAVAEARRVFDLQGKVQGQQLTWPTLQGPRFRDPEIPAHLRADPIITGPRGLVAKREAAKQDVAVLEQRLQELEQQPQTLERDVRVAEAKQAVTNAEQRVHLVNAVIREYVDLSFTPPPTAGSTATPEKEPMTPEKATAAEKEPSAPR
ncbi:MAG: tetratricopeptide repeat protein [Candidatus Rokubacteria bacterium]|nr:tetratricopeptide repeat protein [Candidatus Rokubacteria bacterium]